MSRRESPSHWRRRWRVFASRRVSVFALWLIAIGLVLGGLAEFFPVEERDAIYTEDSLFAITMRTLWGARWTLAVGVVSTMLATFVGVVAGSVLAMFSRLSVPLVGAIDALSVLPVFLIAMLAMALLPDELASPGQRLLLLVVVLGLTQWLAVAHAVRHRIRIVAKSRFIQAATTTGTTALGRFFRHILPHAAGPVALTSTMTLAECIGLETVLSFLRVGIVPPYRTLGTVLVDAYPNLWSTPSTFLIPALVLALLVVGLQLIGDALFDAAVDRGGSE